MTYYSKIHIKVSKFNDKLSRVNFHPFWTHRDTDTEMDTELDNKLSRPNFCPFWTPVNL